MASYTIEPTTVTQTIVKTIGGFKIASCFVTPFESAMVQVFLLNQDGEHVENANVMLDGTDYAAWGDNDQFLVTKVAERLGYTLKP